MSSDPVTSDQPIEEEADYRGTILALKIVSLFIIPAIAFGGVLLPMFVKKIRENENILSYCNVISGALLLGFGFLSMLPEAISEFKPFEDAASGFPIIYAVVFLSFFLVLTLEHFMNGIAAKQEAKEAGNEPMYLNDGDSKKKPLLGHNNVENGRSSMSNDQGFVTLEDDEANHGHLPEKKKKPNNIVPYLLVAGLGFHAVFEGLVLGLGTNLNGVVLLLVAIAVSMFGEGFAMGISFVKSSMTRKRSLIITGIFSLMTPLGTVIGIALEKSPDVDEKSGALVSAIASAIACGIFLYTATVSVFVEEFKRKDGHVYYKILVAVVVFLIMGFLKLL